MENLAKAHFVALLHLLDIFQTKNIIIFENFQEYFVFATLFQNDYSRS